jgi:hypothetical protein
MSLALAIALLGSSARADVPPPDDYVEVCTSELQARPGETCVTCTAVQADTTCETTWTAQGYHRRCSQWGATVRNELWCDGDPPLVDQPTMNSAPANTEMVMIGAIAGVGCCALGVAVLAVGGVLVMRKKKQ